MSKLDNMASGGNIFVETGKPFDPNAKSRPLYTVEQLAVLAASAELAKKSQKRTALYSEAEKEEIVRRELVAKKRMQIGDAVLRLAITEEVMRSNNRAPTQLHNAMKGNLIASINHQGPSDPYTLNKGSSESPPTIH